MAAATRSIGLHAAAAWLLGTIELGPAEPARLTPRLEVFLLPRRALVEDPPPTIEPRPSPPSSDDNDTGNDDRRAPASATPVPLPTPPPAPRARTDWDAEIARAVERLRLNEPRYRSFGFPEPADDASGDDPPAAAPDEIGTTAWGEQRTMINERCYESRYAPGSVLGEAHRFMNPLVICTQGTPAEPPTGLFEDVKPAYLR